MPDDKPHPYWRDWREVRPFGGTSGGSRMSKEEEKEFTTQTNIQRRVGTDKPWFVGSRPQTGDRDIWQVVEVRGNRTRVDSERVISQHKEEKKARYGAEFRANQLHVPYRHSKYPGPFTSESVSQDQPEPGSQN